MASNLAQLVQDRTDLTDQIELMSGLPASTKKDRVLGKLQSELKALQDTLKSRESEITISRIYNECEAAIVRLIKGAIAKCEPDTPKGELLPSAVNFALRFRVVAGQDPVGGFATSVGASGSRTSVALTFSGKDLPKVISANFGTGEKSFSLKGKLARGLKAKSYQEAFDFTLSAYPEAKAAYEANDKYKASSARERLGRIASEQFSKDLTDLWGVDKTALETATSQVDKPEVK